MGRLIKPFLEETLDLVDRSELSIAAICKGAGVELRWLNKVRNGDIPNPGVIGIQKIYDFLIRDHETEDSSV